MGFQNYLRLINLILIILFPISWFIPLLEIGLYDKIEVPLKLLDFQFPDLFGLEEVTIVSGIQSLWAEDKYLALLVTFFALFAPVTKTIGSSRSNSRTSNPDPSPKS